MNRYLVKLKEEPSDEEDIKKALVACKKIVVDLKVPKVVILVPTLNNMKETSIEKAFGEALTARLLKNRSVHYKDFIIELKTIQTFNAADGLKSVVIGVYATDNMFDKLNEIKSAEAIIAIPWIMTEAEKWIATWKPEIIE